MGKSEGSAQPGTAVDVVTGTATEVPKGRWARQGSRGAACPIPVAVGQEQALKIMQQLPAYFGALAP